MRLKLMRLPLILALIAGQPPSAFPRDRDEEKVARGAILGMAGGAVLGAAISYPIVRKTKKDEVYWLIPAMALGGGFVGASYAKRRTSNPDGISSSKPVGGAVVGGLLSTIPGMLIALSFEQEAGPEAGAVIFLTCILGGIYMGALWGARRDIPIVSLRF